MISMLKRKAENNVLNTANYGIDEAVVLCEATLHVEERCIIALPIWPP